MARYAITILTIGAIIFIAASGAGAAPPQEPKEFTVLTYNTHLFYASAAHYMCDLCNDFLLHIYPCCDPGDFLFEDEIRREYIVAYIIGSGADIVALQEVWAPIWQVWFANVLSGSYQYAYFVDSSCDSYFFDKDTLSNGLVLLSKWPLSSPRFRKFPTYFPSCFMWEFCENWADKGVLTADVNVGGLPIRVGISHALTRPHDEKGLWPQLWTRATTPFQLNGESYIFALDGVNLTGYIFRMEDYGRCWDEKGKKYNYGAGWKLLYGGFWGSESSKNVTSFELDGHTYLFEVDNSDCAHIRRINDDPSTGWSDTYDGTWFSEYAAIASFELDGHPYIFTHSIINDAGHIFRINDDPCTGWSHMYGDFWPTEHAAISTFELNGHPYIFTHSSASINAYIKRINDDPCTGWTTIYEGSMDIHSVVESFKLDGHPYLFGLLNTPPTLAFILRINDDPCTGWTLNFVDFWDPNEFPYFAVKSFEMNGHPYLFAKRNCCEWMECEFVLGVPVPLYPSNCDSCNQNLPGEAYLKRINDDPNTGWEDLLQLEDIKIIRDQTVVDEDGPPAIMMGDFNIHADKNGIMDQIFRKAGAVDAYIEVHGTGAGGETVDLRNNKFHQHLCQDDPATPGNECDPYDQSVYTKGRIDYVYYKPSGAGLRIVPKEACVIRDWQYHSEDANDQMDLSDHYPLLVKFKIFEGGCTARAKGDLNCDRLINFADYAILASAWMSGPNDISWDGACDMSDPADDIIDTKDVDAFAREWLTMPVHNVTGNTWYGFIQAAIDDAGDGDEIQVAPGTYYEAINFNGKAVRLYSSGGPEVTTIDPKGIGGAYHVVQCVNGEDANTILEGFTITGGNADGPDAADKLGGGMYNKNSNPMVINCTFSGNSASRYGGGMYNSYSSPTVTGCNFTGNTADTYGGGMCNLTNSSPTVTDCTFSDNSANADGGGMYNVVGSPTIIKCTFSGNSAHWGGGMCNRQNSPTVTNCTFSGNSTTYGGGMYNYNSSPTVTNCTFSGNTSVDSGGGMCNVQSSSTVTDCIFSDNQANGDTSDTGGGGMRNLENSNPTITKCTFINNNATSSGGGGMDNRINSNPNVTNCTFSNNSAGWGSGMFNGTNCSPKVTNCTFSGNSANGIGGGMYNLNESSPTVTNCMFSGNSAVTDGGGMDNRVSSDPNLTNCTFSSNSATGKGGGMDNYYSNPTVTNCILWGNTAPTGPQINGGSPAVTYSDIQGALWPDTGNINSDPCFVDAIGGNLRLRPQSLCIDSGNNYAVPSAVTTDLDGNPRFVDDLGTVDTGSGTPPVVDMGAYEYLISPPPQSRAVDLEYMAILCANWLAGTEPEL
jgi:endonuclease/exonuclease/phosphatase family metal-dependent hydrolase